jgi:hypothetical protein
MFFFSAEDIVELFKKMVGWIIINIIFSTRELKDEVIRQLDIRQIRIPGVCYGCNVFKGYRAIGEVFPQRSRIVRLDYILGYVKTILMAVFIIGLIIRIAMIMV